MPRLDVDPILGAQHLLKMHDAVCADRDRMVADPPVVPTGCCGVGFAVLEGRLAQSVARVHERMVADCENVAAHVELALRQVQELIAVDEDTAAAFAGAGRGGKF
ncbi:MAG: hypothetical protein SPI77_07725 [Corynebacterium sp.]|nr:hypothetical protein [Corynebacterium sp.]